MKRYALVLFPLLICLVATSSLAQDKIYSLSVKEHEIESAIHQALIPHVNRGDYVVKVRLSGVKETEQIRQSVPRKKARRGMMLPGFEPEEESVQPQISDVVGDTYWKIQKAKVDLIMHKEIAPSVDLYIRKTIPIIADLNPGRGDVFSFVPIIPKAKDADFQETDAQGNKISRVRDEYYGLSVKEWVYTGIIILLGLLLLFLIWKVVRMKQNLLTLVDAIEGEGDYEQPSTLQSSLNELEKAKKDRLKDQEKQYTEELLSEENQKIIQDIITQLIGRPDFAEQIIEEFSKDKQDAEKLTQLVTILGPNISRKVFSDIMGKEQYLKMEEMAGDVEMSPTEEKELLRNIQNILFTKQLMFPEKKEIDSFAFLKELTPDQVTFLIKPEAAKIKAIVLSRISSDDASIVLSRLSKEERGQVAVLIGNMAEMPAEMLEKIGYQLAAKAQKVPEGAAAKFDGVDMLVDVIGNSGAAVRSDIINTLRVSDRKLSSRVEEKFFLFDSIPVVPQDILTAVVRRMPSDNVLKAIFGASTQLQEKVIMCFPQKIRRTLVASLKAQKPDAETIRKNRKQLVQEMQKLGEQKVVDLRQIHAAWEKVASKRSSA